jgi:hypothetical protein
VRKQTSIYGISLGLPLVGSTIAAASYLLWRDDVPNSLATHFDLSGKADEATSVSGFFVIVIIMGLTGLIAGVTLSRMHSRLNAMTVSVLGFLAGFLSGLAGGIASSTLWAHRGLDTWTQATNGLGQVVWTVGLAIALGVAGAALASPLITPEPVPAIGDPTVPAMNLAPGESAVWAGNQTAMWAVVLAVGILVVGATVVLGVLTQPWTFVAMLPGAALALALSNVHVRADNDGLRVKYGMLPYPRTNIKSQDIRSASVIEVRPRDWGGWGYRGSLKLFKRAAVVQRSGPGIRVDLEGGKVFVVTVDEPAEPVALLNGVVARAQALETS